MSKALAVGKEFSCLDDLLKAIRTYEDSVFTSLSRIDSKSIEKAEQKDKYDKKYNQALKYVLLTYACTYGGKKLPSRSCGIRAKQTKKTDCPVLLKIVTSVDRQKLLVSSSDLDSHNHELNETKYQEMMAARENLLDDETEEEIASLVDNHEDKRVARIMIRDKLIKETGKAIEVKHIRAIERRVHLRQRMEALRNGDDSIDNEEEEDDDEEEDNKEDEISLDKSISPEKSTDSNKESEKQSDDTEDKKEAELKRPKRRIREPKRFMEESEKTNNVDSGSERDKKHKTTKVDTSACKRRKISKTSIKSPSNGAIKVLENGEDQDKTIEKVLEICLKMSETQEKMLKLEEERSKVFSELVSKVESVLEKLSS